MDIGPTTANIRYILQTHHRPALGLQPSVCTDLLGGKKQVCSVDRLIVQWLREICSVFYFVHQFKGLVEAVFTNYTNVANGYTVSASVTILMDCWYTFSVKPHDS